jgi:hypothetical protein
MGKKDSTGKANVMKRGEGQGNKEREDRRSILTNSYHKNIRTFAAEGRYTATGGR